MKDETIFSLKGYFLQKNIVSKEITVIFIFTTEKNQRKNVNQLSKGFYKT
jgi:hypothetical protein